MFNLDKYNKSKYDFVKSTNIDEINVEFIELKHKKTKASIVLLKCDDINRVFNIAFKTPVSNSKGTPHILEHSVLCGSRKYDVKDPFVELVKSSVNTFLNAMTFPDKTCYPVASANIKDFHNLVDVYLDAVFYPRVLNNDKIFKQEGWHYEIENRVSELKVNGVVLNEMRGVYSNPDDILESAILQNQFEGTNYEFDYGGNPKEIINLSFEEFKDFHKKYYSPSNSIIYYYGDLNFNEELAYLDDNYLNDFDYIDTKAYFSDCKINVKDREVISYYNTEKNDSLDKAYFSYNFTIDRKLSSLDRIVIDVLNYILFSSDSSILSNKLLEGGFGESIYTFSDFGLKSNIFSIISQNIDFSKKDDFKIALFDEINNLIKNGINANKIKAGLNYIYFQLEEGEFGQFPKGLAYILTSLETYLYDDKDINVFLTYKKEFEYLNSIDLSDKNNIFYKMLKELFIDNEHRTINILKPKYAYIKEKEAELNTLLANRKEKLSFDELNKIIEENKELKEYQKTKDSDEKLKCVPTLKIKDLEMKDRYSSYDCKKIDNVDFIIINENESDVIYFDFSFDISDVSKEELYLFSVIEGVLTKVNLKNISYDEFNDYIDINTGGLNIYFQIFEKTVNFTFSLKVTPDKVDVAYKIIEMLLFESEFIDKKRISIIINEIKANSLVSILSKGHLSAANRAESNLSFSASMQDKLSSTGIAAYKFYDSLSKIYNDNADLINETISLLYKKIITKKMYLAVSLNKRYNDIVFAEFNKFNSKLIKDKYKFIIISEEELKLNDDIEKIKLIIQFNDFEKKVKKEAILAPIDVNFVAVANRYDADKYSGKLRFLQKLFSYEYLWTNLRVLGGAYGCMSYFKKYGAYIFTSYRDPNLSNTNKIYFGVYDYLKNFNLTDNEIEKMIIGATGTLDNPLSIKNTFKLNVGSYFNNITDEDIKKERMELITTKKEDVIEFSEIFKSISDSDACAIISGKSLSEAKDNYDVIWKIEE